MEMMEFDFLGGAAEVGRSAIMVNGELLMDYGIKPSEPPTYPVGAIVPKTVLISHGHLDHCGVVPNLMDIGAEIYCTPMTKKLGVLLAKDTLKIAEEKQQPVPFYSNEIKQFERLTLTRKYGEAFTSNGYKICFSDAGHIPGSSMIHVTKGEESFFYTGDLNINDTLLQRGAALKFPKVDTLIIESTYWGRNHVSRRNTENRFIKSIKETVDHGGHAIIPSFAIGRTQEILMVLKKNNLFAKVDGMGVDVGKLIRRDPASISNPGLFTRAFANENIMNVKEREKALKDPSIIVATAGMLNGGPVLSYIERVANDPRSKILLTGYQVEGTNGWHAINNHSVKFDGNIINLNCHVERYNFSAHADDTQLKTVAKTFADNGTQTIIVVHGDRTEAFANWIRTELGISSYAPEIGDKIIT